jgi:membrane protease YdiL (CAAX protease family)
MVRAAILAVFALLLWNAAFALSGVWGVWVPIIAAAALIDGIALRLAPQLRPRLPRLRALAVGAAATLVQVLVTYLLFKRAEAIVPGLREQVVVLYRLLGHPSTWQAWFALPFVAVSEEVIYRGALQSMLVPRLGRLPAVALAAMLYALAHVASASWALVAVALVCGLFWGLVRELGGSLWASVACHLVWDVLILVVVPLAA